MFAPIPQLDGDLDLLSDPVCASNLASEPDEPEQVFGTGYCDNLSCLDEAPDYADYEYYQCKEFLKKAIFKNKEHQRM